MRFQGAVDFKGIQMQVKQDQDATRFLLKALPTLDQRGLEMTCGAWRDLGRSMPADRRKWHDVTWTMKHDDPRRVVGTLIQPKPKPAPSDF